MTCYHPIDAWRSASGRDPVTGKWPITFERKNAYLDMPIQIPCGQCIGCRLERSRQWAIRCVHEASLWPHNSFVTLTYNNYNLPAKGTLVKRDVQLFLKRLRKHFCDQKIRFYMCGEYGEKLQRPHYHLILFNLQFPDKKLFKFNRGYPLYTSDTLSRLWPFGFHTIGDVTFETCAYTARYILKKVNGDLASDHYQGRLPEYTCMSRKPGIAHDWYETWKDDVYPHDYVIIRDGIKCRPPRYYDHLFEIDNKEVYKRVKWRRKYKSSKSPDNSYERLQVRKTVQLSKLRKLIRPLEIINNKINFKRC